MEICDMPYTPDQEHDEEWEQERPLWEAEQSGDPKFREAVSLEEFKKLADEYFKAKEEQLKNNIRTYAVDAYFVPEQGV
jgi:hypothetical protein